MENLLPEANRCLQCPKPRCKEGCPIHTEIPQVIALIKEGKTEEAGAKLFMNNPLSAICSLVCDWDRQCFGSCVLSIKSEGIHFYEMEQEVSLAYLQSLHLSPKPSRSQKVAIIGAGPAGMVMALLLAKEGVTVDLLDGHDRLGGVLRYGIPDFRLSKTILEEYERLFQELGIHFLGNKTLGKDFSLPELQQTYQAVGLAMGAGKGKALGLASENLPHIHAAVDYLANPEAFSLGKKVIVIGGGNVAMDAARMANHQGYNTTVYYRKTFENMPANQREVEEAQKEGVKFEVFKAPVQVTEKGMVFAQGENVKDEKGKTVTRIIENTEEEVQADAFLVAVSQTTDQTLLLDQGLVLTAWGTVEVKENQTSLPGVFASGDMVLGPRTVVEAVVSAKQTVAAILAYLQNH